MEVSVVIRRPVEDVFAYLAKTENETEWQTGLIESKVISGGPVGVGSTGQDTRKSMGMTTVTHWVCTDFEPSRGFSFRVTKPMRFFASYRLDPTPEGTQVTMSAQPEGFTKLVWPLIVLMGRGQYQKNFDSLKRVLEV